jgi:ribonuclease HI
MKGAGFGHIPSGTNNVAELTGALEGLKHAYEVGHRCLTLVSDSEYTLGMTNRSMVPNKNLELVEEIRTLTAKMQVVTRWVPGHSTGGPDESINQWCDLLAKEGKKSENLF